MEAVYLVIPDEGIRDALKGFLESFDLSVLEFSGAGEFLDKVGMATRGCAVVDVELPGINGLRLLRCLRDRGNEMPVALLVNAAVPELQRSAMRAGATVVLEKPLTKGSIVTDLERLFEAQFLCLA